MMIYLIVAGVWFVLAALGLLLVMGASHDVDALLGPVDAHDAHSGGECATCAIDSWQITR